MTLANILKDHLPKFSTVISDNENLLLNRRDFHVSQISPVNAFINVLGVRLSYPYRVLMSFLDQICSGLVKSDFNLVISDPSLSVAGFYCFIRSGGGAEIGRIYAPKGCAKFPDRNDILKELLNDFRRNLNEESNSKPENSRRELFTIVLGNTKTGEQTIFAADRYHEANSGILILKDYARFDAFDERDYLESKLIFPSVTFEGHGFALKQ